MNELAPTPELLAVAERVVWFKRPEEALADPVRFLAHVMVYGTVEDLVALRDIVPRESFMEVLERAPPGVFDTRSWNYWNLVLAGRLPPPAMPVRPLT